MSLILLVAGSLTELRRLHPIAAALKSRAADVRVHWLGDRASLATVPPALAQGVTAHAATGGFAAFCQAATGLLQPRPQAVVVAGSGPAARATAVCAADLGIQVVHVDAGVRTFAEADATESGRRAVDHQASLWLCATQNQGTNLRREGLPHDRVHTVGSALATALGEPAATADARIVVWLDTQNGKQLEADLLAFAASQHKNIVVGHGDLASLRGAAAVVTDCADVQEAACALRVPCVTATPWTARPETVDCGANQIAGPDAAAIRRALAIAMQTPRTWQLPWRDGSDAAAAAILQATAPRPAAAAPTVPTTAPGVVALPSDGDWTGRTLGYEECELAARAIRSGTLNSTKGTFVARFEQEFAAYTGRKHAIACASGSAAVHCAINALQLRPGDEVITTPITDMGALTCILYEGGIPVFADVDPVSINVTAATIAAQITDRTRAIVVTHLFGLACDMAPIMELAKQRQLIVVEDMAQAFGSTEKTGRPGSFGALSCYSLQQGKHMTTGEGGVVTTDDKELARRVFLFVNKAWGYGDPKPDHYFPALNYRLTELQGAVALAQLKKLDWVVERRRDVAAQLTKGLQGVAGLLLPGDPQGGRHSWWKYAFFVDPEIVDGGAVQLGKRMKDRGVFCVPRYIQKPAFECQLFTDFTASPVSQMPLEHNPRRAQKQPLFDRKDYPGTVRALDRVIVLPINELYQKVHVDYVCDVIRTEAKVLAHA